MTPTTIFIIKKKNCLRVYWENENVSIDETQDAHTVRVPVIIFPSAIGFHAQIRYFSTIKFLQIGTAQSRWCSRALQRLSHVSFMI